MKVENFKRFSLKMLRCEARAFPVCTAYCYIISRPFFYSVENVTQQRSMLQGETFLGIFLDETLHELNWDDNILR